MVGALCSLGVRRLRRGLRRLRRAASGVSGAASGVSPSRTRRTKSERFSRGRRGSDVQAPSVIVGVASR